MTGVLRQQRGAALIIVLLLAATLSFLMLALVALVSQSAKRTGGAQLRSDLLWRAVSAEAVAAEAIREAFRIAEETGAPLTRSHPLFAQQLDIPFENGAGAVIFADASACFNVNSLAAEADDREAELTQVLTGAGIAGGDARTVAAAIRDWIDPDTVQSIGGAEDNFYAGLPTPYRTGNAPLSSITEMRAMRGVTAELYAAASPLLCALPASEPAAINVNTLPSERAMLLTAASDGQLPLDTAVKLLEERPPGGWNSVDQFLAAPVFQDDDFDSQAFASRISVKPHYIEAIAGATVAENDISVRLLFSASDIGNVSLISRELRSGQ